MPRESPVLVVQAADQGSGPGGHGVSRRGAARSLRLPSLLRGTGPVADKRRPGSPASGSLFRPQKADWLLTPRPGAAIITGCEPSQSDVDEECGGRDAKRISDAPQRIEPRARNATFDAIDRLPVQAGQFGQLFLREHAVEPDQPNALAYCPAAGEYPVGQWIGWHLSKVS